MCTHYTHHHEANHVESQHVSQESARRCDRGRSQWRAGKSTRHAHKHTHLHTCYTHPIFYLVHAMQRDFKIDAYKRQQGAFITTSSHTTKNEHQRGCRYTFTHDSTPWWKYREHERREESFGRRSSQICLQHINTQARGKAGSTDTSQSLQGCGEHPSWPTDCTCQR